MKRVHLICNAHLDPVWLWRWQEGCTEALSTFRTAEAFTEEFPDFVFNHNEAILYEWVKENEPELFRAFSRRLKRENGISWAAGIYSPTAICQTASP